MNTKSINIMSQFQNVSVRPGSRRIEKFNHRDTQCISRIEIFDQHRNQPKWLVFNLALIIMSMLVLSRVSLADTVQLSPSKDNTLYFSNTGSLSNGSGSHLFVGQTNQGSARRAVIAFDISGNIPSGATITNVTLTLNATLTGGGAVNISLYHVLADWGEGASNPGEPGGNGAATAAGDATWIHRFSPGTLWGSAGGDFLVTPSATTSVAQAGAYIWGTTPAMVSDVQTWLDTPENNFGWILVGPNTPGTAKRFSSRENSNQVSQPLLQIEYTPPAPILTNAYYLPYFRAHTNHWTAVGVKNLSRTLAANVAVTVYNQAGTIKVVVNKEIEPFGQDNFTVADGEPDEGWIKVESDQPLAGLCFFATTGIPNYMADIAFMDTLSTELHVPLVGQGPVFDTTLYICNPNNSAATVTTRFYDRSGTNLYTVNQLIPANGSWVYGLVNMVPDSSVANPGSLEITGNLPIRAFVGYGNTKTANGTMVAGINADPAPQ